MSRWGGVIIFMKKKATLWRGRDEQTEAGWDGNVRRIREGQSHEHGRRGHGGKKLGADVVEWSEQGTGGFGRKRDQDSVESFRGSPASSGVGEFDPARQERLPGP